MEIHEFKPHSTDQGGLIKVHKEGAPIRPVVKWRNAPGYKLAQIPVKVLSSHTPLRFTYTVWNTVQLVDDLLRIPQGHHMKFASFDISNMYSNIPTGELTAILKDLCFRNNVDDTTKKEIMKITQTTINQNYFQFQDTIYLQKERLAMGAPTPSILSDIYLQHMESTTIPELLGKHNIKRYFRYVDDILLKYIDNTTNIHNALDEFNNLTPKPKFTLEEEKNNQINFLDIIIKIRKDLSFDIYRKPTTTDIIIPMDSCHPNEQNTVAIRYYRDRLQTYRLTP
jgi:hypothetical protein